MYSATPIAANIIIREKCNYKPLQSIPYSVFLLSSAPAANASVQGHLHLHALPRCSGGTNFMTTVAETRILPEDLDTTWKRMRAAFAELTESAL
ncbi:MAG: hypothetical protein ABSC77_07780 [Terracidiphilus sp.]